MKVSLEGWKSDDDQEEQHYFMEDEEDVYVFGFNPQVVSDEQLRQIQEVLGIESVQPRRRKQQRRMQE